MWIYIVITIIIAVIIFACFLNQKKEIKEGFGKPIHYIVDKNCNVVWWNYQQPSGNGIKGCASIPCPKKLNLDNNENFSVCWSCCNYD